MQFGATWADWCCNLVQFSATWGDWCSLVQLGANWCSLVQLGTDCWLKADYKTGSTMGILLQLEQVGE